jgi:hypothetical protein
MILKKRGISIAGGATVFPLRAAVSSSHFGLYPASFFQAGLGYTFW